MRSPCPDGVDALKAATGTADATSMGTCSLCDGQAAVTDPAMLARVELFARTVEELGRSDTGSRLHRQGHDGLAMLHAHLHDPGVQVRFDETDRWIATARFRLDSGAPASCPACDQLPAPKPQARRAIVDLARMSQMISVLESAGGPRALLDTGVQRAQALHAVVHGRPAGDERSAALRWVEVAVAWIDNGHAAQAEPYETDSPQGLAVYVLSWLLLAVTGIWLATVPEGEPSPLPAVMVALWLPWFALFVWRARPLGTVPQAILWGTLLWPIAAIELVWTMTRSRLGW